MRIGINLYPLTLRGGGMRHYVLQLLNWLPRLSEHEFLLFYAVHGQPSVARSRLEIQGIPQGEANAASGATGPR